jgi:hypothetical protein
MAAWKVDTRYVGLTACPQRGAIGGERMTEESAQAGVTPAHWIRGATSELARSPQGGFFLADSLVRDRGRR